MDTIEPIVLTDHQLRAIERKARQMRSEVVAGGIRALCRTVADAAARVLHTRGTVEG